MSMFVKSHVPPKQKIVLLLHLQNLFTLPTCVNRCAMYEYSYVCHSQLEIIKIILNNLIGIRSSPKLLVNVAA